MTDDQARALLAATQADRDAAADLFEESEWSRRIRDGRYDDDGTVQAFARHRMAADAAATERAAQWGDVPLVPSIWPFGERAVLTGVAIGKGVGMVLVRPVVDEFVGARDGEEQKAWEAGAGMQLALSFSAASGVDPLIRTLEELKRQMLEREDTSA